MPSPVIPTATNAAANSAVLSSKPSFGTAVSNEEGKATLKAALVSGHYYFRELQTLEGYILDEEKHEFELTLENGFFRRGNP